MSDPRNAPEPGANEELNDEALESVSGGAYRSPIKDLYPPPIELPPYDPIEPIICPVEPTTGDYI